MVGTVRDAGAPQGRCGVNFPQRFPVGTRFRTRGKYPRECVVVDYHVTRNLAGEIVKARYVATHQFIGQEVVDLDVPETTIAMGLIQA